MPHPWTLEGRLKIVSDQGKFAVWEGIRTLGKSPGKRFQFAWWSNTPVGQALLFSERSVCKEREQWGNWGRWKEGKQFQIEWDSWSLKWETKIGRFLLCLFKTNTHRKLRIVWASAGFSHLTQGCQARLTVNNVLKNPKFKLFFF